MSTNPIYKILKTLGKYLNSSTLFLLLLIGSFACPSVAFFKSNRIPSKNLNEIAAEIPLFLLQNGVTHLGNLDLHLLHQAILDKTRLQFIILDEATKKKTGNRITGIGAGNFGFQRATASCFNPNRSQQNGFDHLFETRAGLVFIDPELSKNIEARLPQLSQLLLHESICALLDSSIDKDYKVSAFMSAEKALFEKSNRGRVIGNWSNTEFIKSMLGDLVPAHYDFTNTAYRKWLLEKGDIQTVKPFYLAGGVTVGSGGGDESSGLIKSILLVFLQSWNRKCDSAVNKSKGEWKCDFITVHYGDFLRFIVNLKIEPDLNGRLTCLDEIRRGGGFYLKSWPTGRDVEEILVVNSCFTTYLLKLAGDASPEDAASTVRRIFIYLLKSKYPAEGNEFSSY